MAHKITILYTENKICAGNFNRTAPNVKIMFQCFKTLCQIKISIYKTDGICGYFFNVLIVDHKLKKKSSLLASLLLVAISCVHVDNC